jgi:ubiquinone/menaquinone biosynthesis C-methylase UbiE
MKISESIRETYSAQYDETMVAWRNMAARYKAQNIVDLSREIRFSSVLEVGCGEGSILSWLSQWGFSTDLHGLEISESGIAMTASKGIAHLKSLQLFDGYRIPFDDNRFDLVICSHVLEHVEHERILLREIKRVSRYQIFEVPIDFSFYVDRKIEHYLSYGHINIYTPSSFRFLLKSEKFAIRKDLCHLYADEVLAEIYKQDRAGYYTIKAKHFILKLIPYLRGIKPNAYSVLTEKTDDGLSIFDRKTELT